MKPMIIIIMSTIIPLLKEKGIKCYLIPLPLSDNGVYWSDYANDYIKHYYDEDYYENEYLIITVYFDHNMTLNYNNDLKVSHNLSIENSQIVYDIFLEHLPYNFQWNGNNLEIMMITYDNGEKLVPLVIKEESNYPQINVYLTVVNKKGRRIKHFLI